MMRSLTFVLTCALTLSLVACNRAFKTDQPAASTDADHDRAANAPTRSAPPADADRDRNGAQKRGDSKDQKPVDNNAQANVPVKTATVQLGTLPVLLTAYGTVSGGANSQVSLAFPESGRIANVGVTVGQRVAAGETIARLDDRPFIAQAAQARAELANAQANYVKASAGARPQVIAQTNAQLANAKTQVSVAQVTLSRQQKLLSLGVAAQTDVDTAKANLANAQSQLRVLEQQQSAQVVPYAPDVTAARASVAQAQATLTSAQQNVAYASLQAPFDGVVVARLHNEGETVDPTTPVLQIARETGVVFTAQFSPEDAQRIHQGDAATISAQGTQDHASGHVIAINPAQASDAKSIPVLIQLAGTSLAFGPGAYGLASIQVGTHRGLIIPSNAVVSEPTTGTTQVFRKDGDAYHPVPIAVVQQTGGRTMVAHGELHAGDSVVTEGAYQLLTPQQGAKPDTN